MKTFILFIFIFIVVILGVMRAYSTYKDDIDTQNNKLKVSSPDKPIIQQDEADIIDINNPITTLPIGDPIIDPTKPIDPIIEEPPLEAPETVIPPYESTVFTCPVNRQPPCQSGYYRDIIKSTNEECCFINIDFGSKTFLERLFTDVNFQIWLISQLGASYILGKLADIADAGWMKKAVQTVIEMQAKEAAEEAGEKAAKEAGEEYVERLGKNATKEGFEAASKEAYEKAYKETFAQALKKNGDSLIAKMSKFGDEAVVLAKRLVTSIVNIPDTVAKYSVEIAQKAKNFVTNTLPKLSTTIDNALKTVLLKLGPRATNVAVKTTTKIAVNTGVKLAARIGPKLAAIGLKMSTKLGMGPVGWATLAFDLLSLGLDIADPGGYTDITLQKAYDEFKRVTYNTIKQNYEKEGLVFPSTVGPKNKLNLSLEEINKTIDTLVQGEIDTFIEQNPTTTELQITNKKTERIAYYKDYQTKDEGIIVINITKIVIDYVTKEITNYVDSLPDKENMIESELENLINTKANQIVSYLESGTGGAMLNKKLCDNNDGIYIEATGQCTYKSRDECYGHHSWPLKPDEISTVYRDGKCYISGQEHLRNLCESNGLVYDRDKEECIITDIYCMKKGLDYKQDGTRGDCYLSNFQFIGELIFGETVTRGLKQIFDPAQYLPCNGDEIDLYYDTPPWFKDMMKILTILSYVVLPLYPFVTLYNTAANKMCLKKTSDCPKLGELIMEKGGGALCYIPCDKSEGAITDPHKNVSSTWKSDGETVCYKQYAGWENNGQGHTLTSITKRIVTTPMATPLTDCPSGYTKRGAVCYNNCPANGTDGSYWESDGTHGCYKRPKTWPGNTTTTHLQHDTKYSPAKPIDSCPSGYTKRGAVCYQNCPANGTDGSYWETDGTYGCYKRPSTWPGNTTTTHLQHDTKYSPAKPIDSCPTNKEKNGALCYDKCNTGYTGVGPVCWGTCPANTVDVGALCRDTCRAGYYEVAGVCYENTPSTHVDVGALLREKCRAGYTDVAGVCWENTPGGWSDQGALIRENCRAGYRDVAGVCWSTAACNSGYRDDGTLCTRDTHIYAKSCRTGTRDKCQGGSLLRGCDGCRDDGLFCWCC